MPLRKRRRSQRSNSQDDTGFEKRAGASVVGIVDGISLSGATSDSSTASCGMRHADTLMCTASGQLVPVVGKLQRAVFRGLEGCRRRVEESERACLQR